MERLGIATWPAKPRRVAVEVAGATKIQTCGVFADLGDNGSSFSAAISERRDLIPSRPEKESSPPPDSSVQFMKPELVKAASEVIENQQILVNMVSRRVRQLTLGHRPLVEFVPGMGHADIALSEIANGKLTFESTHGQNGDTPVEVVQFPGVIVGKKPKKAA
jgi:DNA-directed RNA polymerase subunit omega